MNFLISGANGYLGSRLANALEADGHRVIRILRTPSPSVDGISAEDIQKRKKISVPIDFVIHCATCYGRNGESDAEIAQCNIMYALSILEYAALNRIPYFINIGTSLPADISTYAFTKSQFVEWGKHYAQHHKINFIHLLLEHFYGPAENAEQKFIAMVIHNLLQNKNELRLTAGEQIRDFIHVADVINAIQTVIVHADECHGFKMIPIGSGIGYRIKDVVSMIHHLTESRTELHFGALEYRQNELMYSCADISILKKWGWTPEITLCDGLKQIIKEQKKCVF